MRIECKPGVKFEDFQEVNTALLTLLAAFCMYCDQLKKPCIITSIKSDCVKGRSSTTHCDGRAFDASSKHFTKEQIDAFVNHTNIVYKGIAATSLSDGEKRAVIYHKVPGSGYHFHFQVKR